MLPIIIVITGIDGSGKTTQSQLLVKYFKEKKIPVGFEQQFSIESRLGKFILKRTGSKLIKMERSTSEQSYFNLNHSKRTLIVRKFLKNLAKIRIILIGLYHTWSKILKNRHYEVLIFDRYYIDDLNKVKWMYGLSKNMENLAINLVPKPNYLFYLDLNAEIAWKREIDCNNTLEQHIKKKKIYDQWFKTKSQINKNFHKIKVNTEILKIHKEIISHLNFNSD